MARKSSKKDKGLPSSVGKFDPNAGLQANAFTQVKTKPKPVSGALGKKKELLILAGRKQNVSSEDDGEEDEGEEEEEEEKAIDNDDDLEFEDYESRPRSFGKRQNGHMERLPIKSKEGIIQPMDVEPEDEKHGGQEDKNTESNEEDKMERDGDNYDETQQSGDDERSEPTSNKSLPSKAEQLQQILETKEELAQIALALNEDPEENSHLFRRLREISQCHIPTIKKLALATQLSVYKSVIPGYRIRPLTAEEQTAKVTKEVKKLRNYEQALVYSYQQYVDNLAFLARGTLPKGPKQLKSQPQRQLAKADQELAHLAVTCASGLLIGVPHFNFRTELLKILVDRLSKRTIDATHTKARQTLEELFRTDEDGTVSLDAVQLLVKMFKTRRYNIHESVLNSFLSLRLLAELDVKASQDRVDKVSQDGETRAGKKRKHGGDPKKGFRTKRQKKLEREQAAVLNELKEADAVVSHEERERMQSEALKLVFGVYFRILKERPEGNNLMAATLEGLAKFAHLINVDFFTTILTALKELIQDAAALASPYFPSITTSFSTDSQSQTTRESLLCIATAFALLSGQQQASVSLGPNSSNKLPVPLDLSFFTSRLFTLLLPLSINPDLELNHKSLRLPDPSPHPSISSASKVNLSTQTSLLIRSLTSILTPSQPPRPPPSRAAAFTKRLLGFSLSAPEKSSIAGLGIIAETCRKNRGPAGHAIKGVFRIGEKVGDGTYRCWLAEEARDVEYAGENENGNGLEENDEEWLLGAEERVNPLAGTAWEVDLLGRHYSPKVRDAVQEVVRGMGGGGGERSTGGGVEGNSMGSKYSKGKKKLMVGKR